MTAVNTGTQRSKKTTVKILLLTVALSLLVLCSWTPQAEEEEGIAKYLQDSEFVVHGKVGKLGTGMDGSLASIGFTVREVLKGNYAGAEVNFDSLPPGTSGGMRAFDLFKARGHDYIVCFKRGAEEGKYEYTGPSLTTPGIIANGANVAEAKRIIGGVQAITWFDTVLPWWGLVIVGFVLLAATVAVALIHIIRKRRAHTKA